MKFMSMMLTLIGSFIRLFSEAQGFHNKWVFLKYAFENFLNKLFKLPCSQKEMCIQFKQTRVSFGTMKSELSTYIEIYLRKAYELESDFVAKEKEIVFDVGANIGLYTIRQGMRAINGRVFSFEPNCEAFRRLLRNIEINNLHNIIAFNKALWRERGKVFLSEVTGSTTTSTCCSAPSLELSEVEAITLDEVVEEYAIDTIHIMKIDVEGSELDVLQGGGKALDYTEKLMMECHSQALKKRVEELLFEKGFTKVREVNRKPDLYLLYFKKR